MPNLIADMNAQKLAFTAHDGDLKAGGGRCDDQIYLRFAGLLQRARGAGDLHAGRQRLDRLRSADRRRFSSRWSGSTTSGACSSAPITRSASAGCGRRCRPSRCASDQPVRSPCVENRRWDIGGVTYATLNVQGSCNNLCDTAPDPAEFAARNAANIVWLRETFAHAAERGSAAIMLITQANPGWDHSDPTRAPLRNRAHARADRRPARWLRGVPQRAPQRGDRLPQAGGLRARRLALLPRRQAVPGSRRPQARELHARRDVRQQPSRTARTTSSGSRWSSTSRAARCSRTSRRSFRGIASPCHSRKGRALRRCERIVRLPITRPSPVRHTHAVSIHVPSVASAAPTPPMQRSHWMRQRILSLILASTLAGAAGITAAAAATTIATAGSGRTRCSSARGRSFSSTTWRTAG